MSKVAMCHNCEVPLVSTFAFSKYEFYCLDCGKKYGWFDPEPADETPELLTLMKEYEEEFKPINEALLSGGIMLKSCEKCTKYNESHKNHATEEELVKHGEAEQWLKDRIKVKV